MTDLAHWILAFATGALLSVLFFGGLWLTIRRGVDSPHPARLFVLSLLVRTAVTLGGMLLVAGDAWPRWLACALGFLLARPLVLRLMPPREAPHAPEPR